MILTTLLKAYVRGGLFEKSKELLAELEALGYAEDEVLSHCQFFLVCYVKIFSWRPLVKLKNYWILVKLSLQRKIKISTVA